MLRREVKSIVCEAIDQSGGFRNLGKTIAEKLAAWRRYRDTVRELSRMTDRELQDIGIRRGDIHFVASAAIKE